MADYYLHKTAAHIDELLEKVEGLDNYDDTEVRGLINNKVDKVTGKGLSTNDFTDAYKETLDGLDTALDSKVDKETGKGLSTNDFTNAYKTELDGLDTALDGKVDKETGKGLSTNDYTTSEKTKLNGIESGAEVNVQSDWNQTDDTADDFIKNKPNIPAGVVVDQVYDGTSTNAQSGVAIAGALSDKVDKVTGKGLSTNDYTTEEKDKLANLENYNDSDLREQVNAVSDYGKLTINKQRTSYNSTTNKLAFNFDMAAESDTFQLRQVGMIATNNEAIKYQLTLDTAPETDVTYVKIADVSAGQYRQNYNWTKLSVNPGDKWYAVPFMKYDNGDDVYLKYGHLYSVTVNNDGTLAIIAICKE